MTEQEALDIWKQCGLGKTNWTFEFARGVERRTLDRVLEILTVYGFAKDHVTKEIRDISKPIDAPTQGVDARIVELERMLSGERGLKEIWKQRAEEWCAQAMDGNFSLYTVLVKDATRYRWLKENSDVVFAREVHWKLASGNKIYSAYPCEAELDQAVDAAIESQRSGDGELS
jgi:hypothetical protein